MSYAMYCLGLFLGAIAMLVMSILAHFSNVIHMKVKDLTPRKYESIYEIAYLLFGRNSIFVVCVNMFVLNLGALIMYYMLIGDIGSSLMINLLVGAPVEGKQASIDNEEWLVKLVCSKVFSILAVGAALLLIVFKKELNEMKVISFFFLGIVALFLVLLTSMVFDENVAETADFDDLSRVKPDAHLISAVSIIVFAYATQFIVFPSYVELERRSTERFSQVSFISVVILNVAYLATAVCGVLLFGAATTPDLLENIATKAGNISLVIRLTYIVVLLFHIPYVFFAVKEYTLVMYDEVQNRSLSTHLEEKLADFYKIKESKKERETATVAKPQTPIERTENEYGFPLETEKLLERDDTMTASDSDHESQASNATINSVKSALTYKQLSERVFFWTTIVLHAAILLLSVTIKDLTVVFDFTGAISATMMTFIFPAVGYLVALSRYGTSRIRKRRETFVYQVLCYIFIVLGLAILVSYLYV